MSINTPENITKLEPNEIFIFGSNMFGHHAGGAARYAHDNFGAEYGIGEGLSGQTYAFPTLDWSMGRRGIYELETSRDKLFATARALPEKIFLLTKVGCGIASYHETEMGALFIDSPENIVKPRGWA